MFSVRHQEPPRPVRPIAALATAAATALLLTSAVAATATPAAAATTPVAESSSAAVSTAVPSLAVDSSSAGVPSPAAEPETGLWLVQLPEPSLAAAAAGDTVAGRAPAGTLDVAAPGSVSYLDHLARAQGELLAEIEDVLGRPVAVAHTYRNVLNAVAVAIDAAEAAEVAALPGVVSVGPDETLTLDTDVSHELIRSQAVWEGATGGGAGTQGEGVIVGMLDTGVNPHHPSFAAVDGDGYQHTNPFGEGSYVGVCDPGHPQHDDICNNKLIGAWAMIGDSAQDDNGHGSHVGGTIAGNRHEASVTVGDDTHTLDLAGVAPRANVISYKVCVGTSCFASASVAAVDQAIADGVDVLNYSISGPDNPWGNAVDQAFLEAFGAGIFVAASAGNDGPGPDTVAKTAPWNATVAATTHHRVVAHQLDVTAPAPVPPELTGLAAVPGDGSPSTPIEGELRDAGTVDPGNERGCEPFPAGAFADVVALLPRGECAFAVKVDHAAAAGAVGLVVANQFAGPPLAMGGLAGTSIPAVMVGQAHGEALREHVQENADAVTVAVSTGSEELREPEWADVVADFSSRGASQFDLLAPTFAAPGRNILAAYAEAGGEPVQYAFLQGTSMSSPHAAGAGALLAALHPDWSPAQIRSALAVTADREGLRKEDGLTPADPLDVGSGRIDLARAGRAGLVLDESHDNFAAADPAVGGDPRTLNLPAIVDQHCDEVCTFTREVTSAAGVSATYAAATTAPEGVAVSVAPDEFTLAPGASQALEITVEVTGLVRDDWLFGAIDLDTEASHGPDGPPVTGAHFPVAVLPAAPELTVDPTSLESLLDVAETEHHSVTVGNDGGAVLEWHIATDQAGCALPEWVAVMPEGGTLEPFSEQQLEVAFDSTGLDDGGEFTGQLCLASNDPHQPQVAVALALTVVPVPVIEVVPESLAATQPAGLATEHSLQIRNSGHGVLEWTLADEDAGPSEERLELLRDGVLLIPNSGAATRGVMAFDPETGDLIDEEFIPHVPFDPSSSLYTPFSIIPKPDGTGFLMSDQVRWVITEHDLDGSFRGVWAPTSGERDPDIMANTRGLALSPHGTVLVAVAAQTHAHSIVELDADGTFLGHFVAPERDGMQGPWDVLVRDGDVLVSASNSSAIHSFSPDGSAANPPFHADFNWPGQLQELPDGNVLAASWGGGGSTAGVWELSPDGELIGVYPGTGTGNQGVHPLGNGNILTTNSNGVHEIDRDGNLVETKHSAGRGRFVTHVALPDALPCSTPESLPWLSVTMETGAAGAGEASALTVSVDSTGLAAGTHRAQLCVTSNDPATPLVPVPVTLTVTDQTCDTVVSGRHDGPLAVRSGVTCLAPGAEIAGPVSVLPRAGLVALQATVTGSLSAGGAAVVSLAGSQVQGAVSISGSTEAVTVVGSQVSGPVAVTGNHTGATPILISENVIGGPLWCSGNQPPPVDNGVPNTVAGPKGGQCAGL